MGQKRVKAEGNGKKAAKLKNGPESQLMTVPQQQASQIPVSMLPQPAQQYPVSQALLLNSPTGIEELDKILSGGFPKGAVVLLSGSSGSGKTIFSYQWLFDGVRNNENGVYITLTEPLFKSLKNLETMNFYDRNAIEQNRITIVDLRNLFAKKGFDQQMILDYIEDVVKKTGSRRLCIDSVTAIAYMIDDRAKIRQFIFELGKVLATLGCTTILTSEIEEEGRKVSMYGVEEFISDAILKLDQTKEKDELHRFLQIIKVRGKAYKSDDLFFKISGKGISIFPKLSVALEYGASPERISTGNEMLDKLLLGGIFKGSTTLINGASGTGKSLISMQFITDGLKRGENCLYVGFEESRDQLIKNAKSFGWGLEEYEKKGLMTFRCMYPSEQSLEEHLADIRHIVESKKIQRCAVDSLSAVSGAFTEEGFASFARRLNGYLKTQGVTTFLTSVAGALLGATALSESHLSTVTDNIILLRHVEIEGTLRQVMNVVKVRGSAHSKGLRLYDITAKGIMIGQSLSGYEGIVAGVARKVSETTEEKLQAEFRRFVGPIASSVFAEIKERGLTKENIYKYIDDLAEQNILKKKDADVFKNNASTILSGSISEEHVGETKFVETVFSKRQESPEDMEEKSKEKASLLKRLLG